MDPEMPSIPTDPTPEVTPPEEPQAFEAPTAAQSEADAKAEAEAFEAVIVAHGMESPDKDSTLPVKTTAVSEEPAPVASTAQPESVPVEPVLAKITDEDWKKTMASATKIDEIAAALEQRFGAAFGKIGGLEQTVRALQTATPAGHAIEITDEDFKEMQQDFPDLAAMQIKGLNRALSRLKGTGPATVDPAVIETLVDQRVQHREEQRAMEQMTSRRADWKEIVGDQEKPTPYRTWLSQQDTDYQALVAGTWDPEVIDKSIDTFLKQQAKPQAPKGKPGDSRREMLVGGIAPRSAGGSHPKARTEEDEMMDGFREATSGGR